MSHGENPNPIEVNEDNGMAEIADAIRTNAQAITQSSVNESVALEAEQSASAEAGDNSNFDIDKTNVAMDVALDAMGGTVVRAASTLVGVLEDGGLDDFKGQKIAGSIEGKNAQGIEDFIKGGGGKKAAATASAVTDKPVNSVGKSAPRSENTTTEVTSANLNRSIKTPFMSDVFARATNVGDSVNGEDKPKGVQADERAAAAVNVRTISSITKALSNDALGRAKVAEASVNANIGKAQSMGLGTSSAGVKAATLNLNDRHPSAPNFKDTNISEDVA